MPKQSNQLPEPITLRKSIGPSIILLGLALGSGELIMWPYLVSQYGLGIIWGGLAGITFQYFLNTEIMRYTLARGESVFVAAAGVAGGEPGVARHGEQGEVDVRYSDRVAGGVGQRTCHGFTDKNGKDKGNQVQVERRKAARVRVGGAGGGGADAAGRGGAGADQGPEAGEFV